MDPNFSSLALSGELLVGTVGHRVIAYDLSDPTEPAALDTIADLADVRDILAWPDGDSTLVLFGDLWGQLQLHSLTIEHGLRLLASHTQQMGATVMGLGRDGDRVVVCGFLGRFEIVEVDSKARTLETLSWSDPGLGTGQSCVVDGDRVFVGAIGSVFSVTLSPDGTEIWPGPRLTTACSGCSGQIARMPGSSVVAIAMSDAGVGFFELERGAQP